MRLRFAVLFLPLFLLACDDKKAAQVDKSKTNNQAEAVPTDFVLNPFLPEDPKQKLALQVKSDAGALDGGLIAANGEAEESPGSAAAPDDLQTKLLEPGQEPRSERRYALAVGKTDTRTVTVRASASAGGQTQEQPPIKATLAITPSKKTANGFTVEAKVTKIELLAANDAEKAMAAQANQAFAGLIGMGAVFEVSTMGRVSDTQLAVQDPKKARMAQEILPLLLPALEVLYAPLPKGAIGIGAKWETKSKQTDQGVTVEAVSTFTLKSWTGEAGSISGAITKVADKQPIADPRAPKGATMSIDSKGTYEWTLRLDKPAVKLSGELNQTMSVNAGPKSQSQAIHMKQTIE